MFGTKYDMNIYFGQGLRHVNILSGEDRRVQIYTFVGWAPNYFFVWATAIGRMGGVVWVVWYGWCRMTVSYGGVV